jgi:hypothetical protein
MKMKNHVIIEVRRVLSKATCTTDSENATLKPPVAWEDSESGFQLASPFTI